MLGRRRTRGRAARESRRTRKVGGTTRHARNAGKGWLILGHASGGGDHSLFVVELPWKITRGVLVPEADRAAQEDGHGFVRCVVGGDGSASIRIEFPRLISPRTNPRNQDAYPQRVTRTSFDGLRTRSGRALRTTTPRASAASPRYVQLRRRLHAALRHGPRRSGTRSRWAVG